MRRPPRFHNHQQGDDQMATRKINRSVRLGNEVYGPGREDDLAAVLPQASARQLVKRGVLSGDWKDGGGFDVKAANKPDLIAEAERRGIEVKRADGDTDKEPTADDYRAALS